jgi:hypothetical protein
MAAASWIAAAHALASSVGRGGARWPLTEVGWRGRGSVWLQSWGQLDASLNAGVSQEPKTLCWCLPDERPVPRGVECSVSIIADYRWCMDTGVTTAGTHSLIARPEPVKLARRMRFAQVVLLAGPPVPVPSAGRRGLAVAVGLAGAGVVGESRRAAQLGSFGRPTGIMSRKTTKLAA